MLQAHANSSPESFFAVCTVCIHVCFLQALWRTLHNPDDTVANVAFRVLGKFGGSNRKMISTPQPVSYHSDMECYACVPLLDVGVLDFWSPCNGEPLMQWNPFNQDPLKWTTSINRTLHVHTLTPHVYSWSIETLSRKVRGYCWTSMVQRHQWS